MQTKEREHIPQRTTTDDSSKHGISSMQIGSQIPVETITGVRRGFRWEAVAKLLPTIEPGKALPITFENRADAAALQAWIFTVNNHSQNGTKYRAQRSNMTVFISKV